jgi:hypothetical protein
MRPSAGFPQMAAGQTPARGLDPPWVQLAAKLP